MNAYQAGVIGVTNQQMNGKLIGAGFRDLDALVKKTTDFANPFRDYFRQKKGTTGFQTL